MKKVTCSACDGTGTVYLESAYNPPMPANCPCCHGLGYFLEDETCSTCNGTGKITEPDGWKINCPDCGGTGYDPDEHHW